MKEKTVAKTSKVHDPGGKSLRPLPEHVVGSAVFDGKRQEYRYRLERVWDKSKPTALFVMMNPSTADPLHDDPTVAKCRKYATAWGYGRLLVGNTFGYRVTDQKRLLEIKDPVGPGNLEHLLAMAEEADLVVFAYGQPHKSLRAQGEAVVHAICEHVSPRKVHHLALCADGTPKHPLYLRDALEPTVWKRAAAKKV